MMMEEDIVEDHAKLKQGLVKVLKCVDAISSAAAVVNPIFGVAGSLIRVVLHHIDDEDIRTLKREFNSVNRGLDQLSRMNRDTLVQIKKETLDGQYACVEENLKHQFRKFMEMVDAQPEHCERKKDDFEQSYSNDLGDQNLHTLYDGVVGKRKLFSRPILEVYLKHSQGDRQTMEHLCTRLTYLFCIGLIALMGYAAIIGDDEEGLSQEWAEKMEHVQEKMQEVLRRCKWRRAFFPPFSTAAFTIRTHASPLHLHLPPLLPRNSCTLLASWKITSLNVTTVCVQVTIMHFSHSQTLVINVCVTETELWCQLIKIKVNYLGIYYLSTRLPEAKKDSSEGKKTLILMYFLKIFAAVHFRTCITLQNMKFNSE